MPFADLRALSNIHLVYGPCRLLAQYFALADMLARSRGILLRVRTDFDRLLELNERHADSWPALAPMFDPRHCGLSGDKAFWIEGIDETGETAVIHSGRLYDHGARSVADDMCSLQVYYDDPEPHLAAGAYVRVSAPTAHHLCGRVALTGALWVRPDYRRIGLTKFVPRLTRALALTRWDTPAFWGAVEHELHDLGATSSYGSWHVEDGITVFIPGWRGEAKALFLSMGQVTLIRDIAEAVSHADVDRLRKNDTPIAKTSPPRRQGKSSRS